MNESTTAQRDPPALRAAWTALREQKLRQREIADRLQVSEGELLASRVGTDDALGPRVQRLEVAGDAIGELLTGIESLGPVMALTRNEACVHEKDGPYVGVELGGHAGIALGVIDLRLFYRRWRHAFAVEEEGPHGTARSLQFFLADGSATHKTFLRGASDVDAFNALCSRCRSDDQRAGIEVDATVVADYPLADEPDVELFQEDWLAMSDTHEFVGLLRRHGVARTQALRIAPAGHAQRVANDSIDHVLTEAAASGLAIMVFVGNRGCIQIHTGPVVNIRRMGPWLNVLDPSFSLHLRSDLIVESWIVRKPTADGIVTSLELYDQAGMLVSTLFGERKPGHPELAGWRELAGACERR